MKRLISLNEKWKLKKTRLGELRINLSLNMNSTMAVKNTYYYLALFNLGDLKNRLKQQEKFWNQKLNEFKKSTNKLRIRLKIFNLKNA